MPPQRTKSRKTNTSTNSLMREAFPKTRHEIDAEQAAKRKNFDESEFDPEEEEYDYTHSDQDDDEHREYEDRMEETEEYEDNVHDIEIPEKEVSVESPKNEDEEEEIRDEYTQQKGRRAGRRSTRKGRVVEDDELSDGGDKYEVDNHEDEKSYPWRNHRLGPKWLEEDEEYRE